jgi:hypothetical protein
MAYEDSMNAKVALNEGEALISVLTQDFDGDQLDEQIIAYRNLLEQESPIYVTYVEYLNPEGGYRRIWNTSTAVGRPGTLTLYSQDVLGDRSVCILITGMNAAGEHTLTILRINSGVPTAPNTSGEEYFSRIAEIHIDGSIRVIETERTQAYQQGLSGGQSFDIVAYGRDNDSTNILDQVEITYAYSPGQDRYVQAKIARLPGSQVEQRRVRELLSGNSGEFEGFIEGLWYYVSPQGTLDNRQYIYFDPDNRELIFYGEETQQIFVWQNSSPTRYGLYVSSQNISVTTLRRFLDIELESLDSIRVKVFEDVRLKIGVSASWDGSYRKAGTVKDPPPAAREVHSYFDAAYDGSIGTLRFNTNGTYELHAEGTVKEGNYAFFILDNRELLELRPGSITGLSRETYLVETDGNRRLTGSENGPPSLTLTRVRLSTKGIQDVHEAAITLTLAG